jgi:hypothetical protein
MYWGRPLPRRRTVPAHINVWRHLKRTAEQGLMARRWCAQVSTPQTASLDLPLRRPFPDLVNPPRSPGDNRQDPD